MATILLCGVELFLRGKLEALLPEHRFETADGIDPPDVVEWTWPGAPAKP